MNVDLQIERERATFSPELITHMLDGGRDRTVRRRQLESIIERDPTGIFSNQDNISFHRTKRHVRALAKHVRLLELCRILGIGDECHGDLIRSNDFHVLLTAMADDVPTSLHWVMFVPNIVSLCDDEQQAEWIPLCRDWRMIGCYAQTELGHGSNVRGLETTATFVNEVVGGIPGGSFAIHSPTMTSAKFWPGSLGRTANHAMVIARLIDGEGIDRGMHNFLVPLRSMKDHSLLPGVTTGDIGPKLGYNNMDNGYAIFNNVMIPRRNMAMRFATVDEQGKYRKKTVSDATSKVAYITMMQVRAHICNESSKNLAIACTIAIRYSAVRRQGFVTESNEDNASAERQILDYKQQQHRLLPMLAASYCFFFTGKTVLDKLAMLEMKLRSNQSTSKVEVTDLHASLSALKSFTTTVAADGMEDCRKACGGHGYLQSSGFPELITSYLQSPTVEGDNHMLPQQVVKVLLKVLETVRNGSVLSDYVSCDSYQLVPFLKNMLKSYNRTKEVFGVQDEARVTDLPFLLHAFGHRAARLLVQVATQLQVCIVDRDMSSEEAWNESLVEVMRVSRAYSQLLLLRNFCDGIHREEQKKYRTQGGDFILGVPEIAILRDLARLIALYWMEREMGDFLEDGYISSFQQSTWIRHGVLRMLDIIRPNAVALVDARDFSDFRLKSVLGRFDGNVYPAIMNMVRREPLNRDDVGPGYKEHLKRLIVDGVGVYSGTAARL